MRVIGTALATQEGSEVGRALAPLQLAVRITDGACILVAVAQATYTHGQSGEPGCDMLKIDLKNAYGTIRRSDILAGLREHAPALIRWFIISYGSPTQLFHAVHGHVGEVQEGVRQGDPMATIFFAIGFQAAIKRINEHVRAQHPGMPTARAWAFADDLVIHGYAERLLDHIDNYKRLIRELTGMELCINKCTLLLSGGPPTQAVRDKAADKNIAIATEGTVIMGAPVGTDEYINTTVADRVDDLLHDLHTLKHFTTHGQWALLRMCINQRPVYLQRLLGLQHAGEAFERFDAAVTEKVLDILAMERQDDRDEMRQRVSALRCLPLQLSGGAMRSIARTPTRVKALYLCRDNIARFLKVHAETEGDMATIMRQRWASDQLPVVALDAANEPTQMIDDGIVSSALRGHVLGNIPDEAVRESHIDGNPDTSETITRIVAKTRAIDRAMTADLILHSRTLRGMRSSEHQHNKLLAAHVLSSSCPNSGVVVQSVPMANAHVQDERFRHILRLRFGVPSVTPLADWKCNCGGHGGPRHRDWVERASEGNRRDAPSVSFATEPLHGLFCKRRWRRVCYRHNWVRNALAASLNRMPGVQAVLEPMVTTRRAPGDQRRGDIKVIKSGTSWILDVGIICPGSQRLVSKGTDIIPGKAAALYEDKKTKTYSDQANFVPFIVETGGRINAAGLQFLSRILPLEAEGTAGLTRRHGRAALRGISRALALQQGYMLAQIAEEIHAPDRAAQDTGEGGNSEYQDLGLEVDDDDPTDS